MPYYDPEKTYGNGAFRDFMDSGAAKMGEVKSAQQADLDTLVQNLAIEMQEKSGAISTEEAEQARGEASEQIDQDYKDNITRIKSLSLTNTMANTIGIATSVVTFAGIGAAKNAATRGAIKAATQPGLTQTVKTAWSGASGLGKVGAVTGTLVKRGAAGIGRGIVSGVGNMKGLTRLGVSLIPTGAALAYTHNRTDEESIRMQETINSLQSTYAYLSSEDASLTDQIREDTESWRSGYEAGSQELLEQLDAGELTQEEYDRAYEAFIAEQDAKWAEYQKGHSETAEYVTKHGAAYATDDYIAGHGYDPELVNERCETIAKLNEDNPNAYEAAQSRYATQKQLDTGSSFTNFLANLNAMLLHYVPGLAYIEAAAVKMGDMIAGFAANKIPVLSSVLPYEEKHKGESVSEIAKAICTDAEARYELSHTESEAQQVLREGADPSLAAGPEPDSCGPEPSFA